MIVQGKTVMITGANTGIGRETAIAFAKAGARIIMTYRKNKAEAMEVKEICEQWTDVAVFQLNLQEKASIDQVYTEVKEQYDAIDILINNAAVATVKPFIEQTYGEMKTQVDVNLLGVMYLTSVFLPLLHDQEEAIIINVASRLSKKVVPSKSVYAATKFAVRGFTQALALELPKHIRSYCVNPGLTSTRMTEFCGVAPAEVAGVIVKAVEESLGIASGGDVDVEEWVI